MKCLIVLALVAVAHAAPQYFSSFAIPTVLGDGHLADTPEVAIAKIVHLTHHANTLASTSGIAAAPATIADVRTNIAAAPASIFAAPAAVAAPVVSHFAATAPAVVGSPFIRSSYSAPLAVPSVLPSVHFADTPEAANAKAIHLAELAKALSLSDF